MNFEQFVNTVAFPPPHDKSSEIEQTWIAARNLARSISDKELPLFFAPLGEKARELYQSTAGPETPRADWAQIWQALDTYAEHPEALGWGVEDASVNPTPDWFRDGICILALKPYGEAIRDCAVVPRTAPAASESEQSLTVADSGQSGGEAASASKSGPKNRPKPFS